MRAAGIVFLISLLAPAGSWAQVFKCQDASGRTVYSDVGCTDSNAARLMQRERTFEEKWREREEAHSAQIAKQERQLAKQESEQQERQYWAQEHARQSQSAQQGASAERAKKERQISLRLAMTVMPGARGLTGGQREAALELAETPQERAALMREATTVMRGAKGLTSSQLDTAQRLREVNSGRPLPLPARDQNSPSSSSSSPSPSPSPPPPSIMTNCAGGFCHDNQGGVYHQHGNGMTMTGPSGGTCIQSGSSINCH